MTVAFGMSAFTARTTGVVLGSLLGGALLWLPEPPAVPPPARQATPAISIQSISAASSSVSRKDAAKTVLPSLSPVQPVQAKPKPEPQPRAKPEFEQTKTPSPKPLLGTLSVNVIPGTVKIYIDGQLWKGSVPLEILLPVGPHTIAIGEPSAPASARIVRKVVIEAYGHKEIVERM
jgi:hypothetical protein